jgi:hypothetical protein
MHQVAKNRGASEEAGRKPRADGGEAQVALAATMRPDRRSMPNIRASFAKPCADAGDDQAHSGMLARAAAAIHQLIFSSLPVSLCFLRQRLVGC